MRRARIQVIQGPLQVEVTHGEPDQIVREILARDGREGAVKSGCVNVGVNVERQETIRAEFGNAEGLAVEGKRKPDGNKRAGVICV